MPDTVEVRFPMVPPKSRTVRTEFELADWEPFQVSSTAKDVKVQISPASHAVELETQRTRTTSCAAWVICATDMRTSVVELAMVLANNAPNVIRAAKMQFVLGLDFIFVFMLISPQAFRSPLPGRCSMW